ncbi:hypothetical protein FS749_002910 [Ceratobasidium sp. UAMH 11750]|nr:hypothetical protein FS749_002910 [Ceratobasidium sp. UAMH 11750]
MSSKLHPLGYESKTANLSTGRHYRYVDIHPPQGVKTMVTALVLHGFPDSAYGWRHQVKGWSARGIRLIIPDTLGYNGSSQPVDPSEYTYRRHSEDYEALIREAGIPEGEKIVLISHDWGAGIAIRLAQYKPDLVKGIASLCIPFSMAKPAQELFSPEKLAEALPSFGYQLFFVDPRSSAILDAKVDKFIRLIYTSAKQVEAGEFPSWEKKGVIEAWLADDASSVDPALLTEKETDTIIAEIKAGVGFSAMLNYYRGAEVNYELDKNLPQEFRPDIPKLLVVPSADPALPSQLFANEEKAPDVEVVRLEGLCGHWVQLERPAEVEKIVGDWVERMAAKGWVA